MGDTAQGNDRDDGSVVYLGREVRWVRREMGIGNQGTNYAENYQSFRECNRGKHGRVITLALFQRVSRGFCQEGKR